MGHYETLYQRSISDPEGFWAEQAQAIDWFQFPDSILSQDEHGLYRWYKGGMLNTCHLALDYHVAHGRGEQTALIYDSPVTQTFQKYTYRELLDEARCSLALRLICHTDLPLGHIAAVLDYSGASAFTHAFKRWMRVSPLAWRLSNGQAITAAAMPLDSR